MSLPVEVCSGVFAKNELLQVMSSTPRIIGYLNCLNSAHFFLDTMATMDGVEAPACEASLPSKPKG